jgi:diguanylate cyclase (GGDEF)-like protein
VAGNDPQAFALFLASFALSLFAAVALFIVSRTSPAFQGTKWLAGAYFAGAMAAAMRMLAGGTPDSWFLYAGNTLVLSVYVLLHCALLRVLEPGGDRPGIGLFALAVQVAAGPFLLHGPRSYQWRVGLLAILLTVTLLHICYVVLRQGLPQHGRPPSTGMKAATGSMVVVLALNMIFSMVRGLAVSARSVPLEAAALERLVVANMVISIVCATGILLSFLWMTAERLQRDLEIQARLDGLTGLLNRRALEQEFVREAERSDRSEEPLSLLLLDLDHFKFVNDLYGHHAGDLMLCEVARIMQQTLRRVDLLARIGGEEFVALLPQTGKLEVERIAERLRHEIQVSQVDFGRSQLSVTASIGVASRQGNQDGWESLLQRADAAMYRAKNAGRNRVESVAVESVAS